MYVYVLVVYTIQCEATVLITNPTVVVNLIYLPVFDADTFAHAVGEFNHDWWERFSNQTNAPLSFYELQNMILLCIYSLEDSKHPTLYTNSACPALAYFLLLFIVHRPQSHITMTHNSSEYTHVGTGR